MSTTTSANPERRSKARTIELFVFACLVALGATTIVTASWARDISQSRATLLGSDRGISVLLTAGAARVLIVNGTDPTALGNAISKARHPGLERLDLMIVTGNAAGAGVVPEVIELLDPREVIVVGGNLSLAGSSIVPIKTVDHTTEIVLPEGVTVTLEVWPAAGGENDDVTWSAAIDRGDATIYWVSDREALMQEDMPARAEMIVIGRGAPTDDTPFPIASFIVASGESITGPELRELALDSLGPNVETLRVFAGEEVRVDLNPEGIQSVPGSTHAGTPEAARTNP